MQIQNVTSSCTRCNNTNFKSVYPVYHWYKPADKYIPAFDKSRVRRYQKILTGMLNAKINTSEKLKSSKFLQEVLKFVSAHDRDFNNLPYVRTYFDYKGGLKTAWNGNVYEVKPSAYILTGRDAADFENMYGKPLGSAKSTANNGGQMNIHQRAELENAKLCYAYGGERFVLEKMKLFKNPETGNPLELHVIMSGGENSHKAKVIKLNYFETGAKNNPLVTNGIIQ